MSEMIKFDIQLFADIQNDPNMQKTTTPGMSAEMKDFYVKELIETAKANLVHTQFAKKRPVPKNGGKTVEWRQWSHFEKALKPLTEGITPKASALTVSTITKKLEQFGDFSIVTDVLDLTAIDDVIVQHTDRHAENMALTLDTIVRNELMTGTQVIYAPIDNGNGTFTEVTSRGGLTKAAKLNPTVISRAATLLKKRNAPKIDGSYVCLIHPSVAHDLITCEGWLDVQKYSNATNIFNGEIGKLYGVRFIESTECAILVGEDLSSTSRSLTASANSGNSVTVSGLTSADAEKLAGREVLLYNGTSYEHAIVESATATKLTLKAAATIAGVTKVYPGEGGKETDGAKCAAYACQFLGKDAFADIEIDGGNAGIIVKTASQSGTDDPLNQRNTIGWKLTGYGVKILIPEYIVRVECGSFFSDVDEAN